MNDGLENSNISGLLTIDTYYIQLNRNVSEQRLPLYTLVIADATRDHEQMLVLTANSLESELVEVDCSELRENAVLTLSKEGRRWEGGELNGKPFGFGQEYSENDNLVYEGFVYEGVRVCYGKEIYDDIFNNCLVYEGGYCNGERHGKGISYDLNGGVIFNGEWISNYTIMQSGHAGKRNDLIVPLTIEEFVIGDDMCNFWNFSTLHFSPLLFLLKRIEIGSLCLNYARECVINGLPSLESVIVHEKANNPRIWRGTDGVCRIVDCPILRTIKFGNNSFDDYNSFELANVNSLQSIEFGDCCFYYAKTFSLKGKWDWNRNRDWMIYMRINILFVDLPSLGQISMGFGSFRYCHHAVFESRQ